MSDYSLPSKLLHQIALAYPIIGQVCFDIQSSLNRNSSPPKAPIFVAGLARAGTTMLMHNLYQSGEFTSLTYRNMPFVMMPQLWKKISSPFAHHKEKQERVHGDGIMVNFDSAEAFEEVFWRCFDKNSYICQDRLLIHKPNEEVIDNFRTYVANVIADDPAKRYLSKNNNNLLRLSAIHQAFSDAIILIPFRDPRQHAISLLKQHELFTKLHLEDTFSLKYMNWLGHHEFGCNHKPLVFDSDWSSQYTPENIDYWLDYWLYVYSFIQENIPDGCQFICYEDLCANPDKVLSELYKTIEVDEALLQKGEIRPVISHTKPNVNASIQKKAHEIYELLQNHKGTIK